MGWVDVGLAGWTFFKGLINGGRDMGEDETGRGERKPLSSPLSLPFAMDMGQKEEREEEVQQWGGEVTAEMTAEEVYFRSALLSSRSNFYFWKLLRERNSPWSMARIWWSGRSGRSRRSWTSSRRFRR